jgi:hypothetical protein
MKRRNGVAAAAAAAANGDDGEEIFHRCLYPRHDHLQMKYVDFLLVILLLSTISMQLSFSSCLLLLSATSHDGTVSAYTVASSSLSSSFVYARARTRLMRFTGSDASHASIQPFRPLIISTSIQPLTSNTMVSTSQLGVIKSITDNVPWKDDDEDDEDEEGSNEDENENNDNITSDIYEQIAQSEFLDPPSTTGRGGRLVRSSSSSSSSPSSSVNSPTTTIDWGGALSQLNQRMDDISTGKSLNNPAQVLFRYFSGSSPTTMIGTFVSQANPAVIQAMASTVNSLLGGLSTNPQMGVELLVKATGDKIANLCFQLQMTGCKCYK